MYENIIEIIIDAVICNLCNRIFCYLPFLQILNWTM